MLEHFSCYRGSDNDARVVFLEKKRRRAFRLRFMSTGKMLDCADAEVCGTLCRNFAEWDDVRTGWGRDQDQDHDPP